LHHKINFEQLFPTIDCLDLFYAGGGGGMESTPLPSPDKKTFRGVENKFTIYMFKAISI